MVTRPSWLTVHESNTAHIFSSSAQPSPVHESGALAKGLRSGSFKARDRALQIFDKIHRGTVVLIGPIFKSASQRI